VNARLFNMTIGLSEGKAAADLRMPALPLPCRGLKFAQGLIFLVLSSLVLPAVSAQSLPQGDVNSGTSDCNNGLASSSLPCSTPGQQDGSPSSGQPFSSPYSSNPGQYATQTQRRQDYYYSDTEPFTQQQPNARQNPTWFIPPDSLTEFQKFIASATGEVLPVFGASLFRSEPSTFEPQTSTPVPADYVIGPGDELRIHIWGQFNFAANVRVDRSGDIYLPQIGTVHVAGLQASELDPHLKSAFERLYHNFEINVDLGQIRTIQVYVAGEARRPGLYTISSLSTLVDALFESGGPSPQGSLRAIQLKRGSRVIADFDLYDLLLHGDKSRDAHLQPGDVIFVPPVGPEAAIMGSVRVPAIYELKGDESVADLISAAGGTSAVASETRVYIERIQNHSDRQVLEIAFNLEGLSAQIADGDLVRVNSITPTYHNTVILRGNTANPGRYMWHPGMHLTELIPDKDVLVTRNYWWKRAQLGLPAPEFEPADNLSSMVQPADNRQVPIKLPDLDVEERGQLPVQSSGNTTSQNDNAAPRSGNVPTQYGSSEPGMPQTQQTRGNEALAETAISASTQQVEPQQKTAVRLLSPEIDWNYAVIDRQNPTTLKTDLIPFDLGRLVLDHDASQDLELQPGDVVSIFSEKDIQVPLAQQTKLVKLEGEFVHAGVYSVKPDETLRELVERAGGFTPNAYLYGSEFTRESARAIQQARLNEYVQAQELQTERNSLAMNASSINQAQQLAAGTAAENTERQMLARLRQVRATGRIVLRLKPTSSGIDALPVIQLENGDSFTVPPVPENVNVIGAVYDQNSFLYSQGQQVHTYLRMAGNANSNADRKREFIIRADGEVLSRESVHGPWGDEFGSLQLNPGDTIVVPEKIFRSSALRSFIDWSQMFSQFALGAAAISVIQ
jgi:protein involved in polysaccharide export with SLBB domain